MLTARQKFLNWLRCKKVDHGLVNFATTVTIDGAVRRLTAAELENDTTLPDALFADLNRFNAAVAMGKVKPIPWKEIEGRPA